MEANEPVETGIVITQNDRGHVLRVIPQDTNFDATGTTASIIFLKADGNSVEKTVTASDGTYSFRLTGQETLVVGKVVASVKFYGSSGERLSTAMFIFKIAPDNIGAEEISKAYSDSIEQAIAEAREALEAAEQAVALIIPQATSNTLGGIKSGTDVSVNANGTLNIDGVKNSVAQINNNLSNSNMYNAKGYYKDATIATVGWTSLSVPIALGHTPNFVLATPMTPVSGRITWVVSNSSSSTVTINIYNYESTSFDVGFYVLVY